MDKSLEHLNPDYGVKLKIGSVFFVYLNRERFNR